MKNKYWMMAAAAAGLFFPTSGKSATSEKPNILLIIGDDLGPTLGCYGDATAKTPFMDKLAAEGVRFNQAHVTASSCSPSRGSMMTGLYPHQHGMYSLAQQNWARMHDDVPKLPNELKTLGYRTAIVGKTHFEPFNQFQFDYVETDSRKVIMQRDVRWMNSKAAEFLNGQPSGKPFFLVMSYVDPHRGGGDGRYGPDKNEKFPRIRLGLPENPPEPEETKPILFLGVDSPDIRMEDSDYYSCVQRLDTGVGELLAMMDAKHLLDNTLIVLIGDNGPDITRGKISAYASATHIPMLVSWRGHTQSGLVRDDLVSTIDLFPTFLSAAGAENPLPDKRQTGRSLLPLLKSGDMPWRTWLATEFIAHVPWHYYPRYTIFDGKYHFIYNIAAGKTESPLEGNNFCYAWWEVQKPQYAGTPIRTVYDHVTRPPEFELFNLKNDPFEFTNLAGNPEYKEQLEQMTGDVTNWRVQTQDPFLDPAFSEAYAKQVEEMKAAWENRNAAHKTSPAVKKAKQEEKKPGSESSIPSEPIVIRDDFKDGISNVWKSPGGNSGISVEGGGVRADLNQNGLGMNCSVGEAGINQGVIEVSATFVQGEAAVPYSINWNVGFSSDNSKYLQNAGGETVCARFITAGPNKGRFRWAVFRNGELAVKSFSANKAVDWTPETAIRLTLKYDLTSGEAVATAVNMTSGDTIGTDTVSCPGITGFRYAGFEMTLFPKNISGCAGTVKEFVFRSGL